MLAPNQLHLLNPGDTPELSIFHNMIGDQGVCGMVVQRPGHTSESACLLVSRTEHTQQVMHDLFSEGQMYETWTSLLGLAALQPGDIAIDIGAHVGLFSTLFRLGVGPTGAVYAFEPMPDTYRRLLHNVIHNRFTNVVPLPLAIADRSGSALFHLHPGNEGECSLIGTPGDETCQVQVTCLDELFGDILPKRPRLLKIDAEGVEVAILKGATRFFETHAPDLVICECKRGALAATGHSEWDLRNFFDTCDYACAVINNGVGIDLRGGQFYRYLTRFESSAPVDHGYVYNLMFVRRESGLYPAPLM
ncbi:MAG: FkbM family methyltransferase [Rhodocyclales bacterium]|nr:FkbM family methyltransferase [Rhodocyclales bacterium]